MDVLRTERGVLDSDGNITIVLSQSEYLVLEGAMKAYTEVLYKDLSQAFESEREGLTHKQAVEKATGRPQFDDDLDRRPYHNTPYSASEDAMFLGNMISAANAIRFAVEDNPL